MERTNANISKTIFKVKEEVNYDKKDPNYDLFQLACRVDSEKQLLSFSFLDTKFNKKDTKKMTKIQKWHI